MHEEREHDGEHHRAELALHALRVEHDRRHVDDEVVGQVGGVQDLAQQQVVRGRRPIAARLPSEQLRLDPQDGIIEVAAVEDRAVEERQLEVQSGNDDERVPVADERGGAGPAAREGVPRGRRRGRARPGRSRRRADSSSPV